MAPIAAVDVRSPHPRRHGRGDEEVTMSAEDAARRYFEAWIARDPEAIAATFATDGVYADPGVPDGLPPQGTAAYAAGLFAAFPDLSFAVEEPVISAGDRVVARWTMTGTNTGSFMGLPPTGLPVEVVGVDVIEAAGDLVRRVDGYFDGGAVPRQLGMQVIVQPAAVGPFAFGTSTRAAVSDAEPGAMSLTVLEARSDEAVQEVAERSRDMLPGLMAAPGFISFVGAIVGRRMYTITAWESADDVPAVMRDEGHRAAADRFFAGELAVGGPTGVWAPRRLNGMWVRCASCGAVAHANGDCPCGAPATPPPAYW
jgi:steroid delta-isomerase-like uncharacterized protein